MNVLVIGAGGHGQVVADILFRMWSNGSRMSPRGFIDQDESLYGTRIIGLKVLGGDRDLDKFAHDAVIPAIGDNRSRRKVFKDLVEREENMATAIHPSAILAPDVKVGEGCMICAGVIVNTGAVIGPGTILNTGCTVDHHCEIGPFAHIAPGVNLSGNVHVGKGAMMGIGSVAIPGMTIGDWSTVGAGSAVVDDVAPGAIVGGVPARELH